MITDFLNLKAGDFIEITETILTARDKAHEFILQEESEKFRNSIIYHCGPIVKDGQIIAAGPTTSKRMNIFTPEVIEKYKPRAIIGKGGMNQASLEAMKKHGCMYLAATGGAAALMAKCVKKIKSVEKEEFGMPEAIYELEVVKFPATVAVDLNGDNIYEDIEKKSKRIMGELL